MPKYLVDTARKILIIEYATVEIELTDDEAALPTAERNAVITKKINDADPISSDIFPDFSWEEADATESEEIGDRWIVDEGVRQVAPVATCVSSVSEH